MKSDRKSILKKEISLYHEPDEKLQVSSFLPQEPTTNKKATARKKWLPSIEHLNVGSEQRGVREEEAIPAQNLDNENNSSSNSELPQPQLYS